MAPTNGRAVIRADLDQVEARVAYAAAVALAARTISDSALAADHAHGHAERDRRLKTLEEAVEEIRKDRKGIAISVASGVGGGFLAWLTRKLGL